MYIYKTNTQKGSGWIRDEAGENSRSAESQHLPVELSQTKWWKRPEAVTGVKDSSRLHLFPTEEHLPL